jgi:thioredoxin 1
MLAPFLEEAEAELTTLNVSVCKVDVDASADIAASFGIAAVPTVVLLKEGKLVNSFSGLKRPKQIVDFVKENI